MKKSARPERMKSSSNTSSKAVPTQIPKNNNCTFKDCEYPAYKDNFCIFHLPKLTAEEKEKLPLDQVKDCWKIENDFREAFYKLLQEKEEDSNNDYCDFSNFQFVKIDLSAEKLEEVLGRNHFQKIIYFDSATFDEEVNFSNVEFKNKADFTKSKFQFADFNSTKFQSANFIEAKFKLAQFSWAEFQSAHFNGSEFQSADFLDSKFQSVDFIKSEFQNADFSGSRFKSANFIRSKFQNAYFRGSKFQNANFISTEFQSADFNGAEFQNADFFRSKFQSAYFFRTIFLKKATFKGDDNNKCFLGECSFENVEIDRNALVTFQKVRLEQTSFIDTDLEKIVFRDVDWCDPEKLPEAKKESESEKEKKQNEEQKPKKKFRFWHGRKQALWEEFRPIEESDEERDYEKIAENYRQLVLNFERKRDFDTAEQFHIGEMEMRRKKQGTGEAPWRRTVLKLFQIKKEATQQKILEYWNSYNLYRLLSNYGTGYWQALSVLVLLVLLLSSGFLFTGFSPVGASNGQTIEEINYVWVWPWECSFQFKQRAIDLAEAVTFSFSILTFQHSKLYEPSGSWSRFLICLAVILFYSQTALVLLAIRRKFKR